jgi:hypothetical protein
MKNHTNSEKMFKGFLAYSAFLYFIFREAKVLLSIGLIAAGCYSLYLWHENVRLQKEIHMYQEVQRYNRLHIPYTNSAPPIVLKRLDLGE